MMRPIKYPNRLYTATGFARNRKMKPAAELLWEVFGNTPFTEGQAREAISTGIVGGDDGYLVFKFLKEERAVRVYKED